MPPPLAHVVSSSKAVLSSQRLLTPTTNPVPLLSTPTARYASLVQTILIPLYYYFRAPALIRNPLETLVQDLLPIALVQAAASAACLPSAGSWDSGTKDGGKIIEGTASAVKGGGKGSVRKKGAKTTSFAGLDGRWTSTVMPTLFSLLLTFALPTLPLTVLALCLGAPLFPYDQIPHTVLLATHVSLLAFMPLFYTHGVSGSAWRDIAAAWLPFDEAGVWAGAVGSFVGGWIGAIPIALDWDREWQKWPCTVIWGVVLGWTLGRLVTGKMGLGWGHGRRINMSENEEIPRDWVAEMEKKKS